MVSNRGRPNCRQLIVLLAHFDKLLYDVNDKITPDAGHQQQPVYFAGR
jgi:hypothetical protein